MAPRSGENSAPRELVDPAPSPPTSIASASARTSKQQEDDEDPPLASLRTNKRPAPKTQTKQNKVARKTGPPPVVEEQASSSDDDDDMLLRASESDSDDANDMPFRVEYATTGRATCRTCDERISKNALRVAERPLFRGQPGFTVYRHLSCTIFGDQIERLEHVGGWRRLNKKDRELVTLRVEESKLLVEQENQELQPDELVQAKFKGEMRKAPDGLDATLLPFQVEGSSWMYHQEVMTPEIRGGILADEMGMGKTLQTITTILDNRPKLQHCTPGAKHPPGSDDIEERRNEEKLWESSLESWSHEMSMNNVPKKLLATSSKKKAPLGTRAGTLVVCPVIALLQWKEEIKKFTKENALTVCCYHGPNRAKQNPREVLCKYDVVLTTYQVIEADFRKMVSPNKVKCPNCGGSYKIEKLRVHLKYFCGESARRTEAQARQRRTANRSQQRGNGSGRRGGGGPGGKSKKDVPQKKKSTATLGRIKPKSIPKKVDAGSGFDSDSDLSVPNGLDLTSARPSRTAAKTASILMAATSRHWGSKEESESEFSTKNNSESDEDDEVSVEEDNGKMKKSNCKDGLKRALEKQKSAYKFASNTTSKSIPSCKSGKKKPLPDDSPSSSSSSSDESSDDNRDPLEGIDLDKLMQEAMMGSRTSLLHTVCWWRVVLDEAHMIKSRSSQTAAAAFSLTAIHRWCLSGTPLQNRVGELYSLIRFLRIDPMAHYFCRSTGCDCKSIHYRMLHGKCQECGHGSIQHFSHFNKHVLNPIQRSGYQGDGRRAMMRLKDDVLDKALIRRTKQTRAEDMNLPPRVVTIRTIRLHPIEEDFYNALYTQTKSSFDDYVNEGTLLNNYAHIFDLLTKMRQAVDHPYLIVYSKKNANSCSTANGEPMVANGSIDCELCHEPPTDRVVSSCCGSAFCRSCVLDFMSPAADEVQQGGTRCPSCRDPFSIDLSQETSDVVDDGTLDVRDCGSSGVSTEFMPSLKEMSHVSSGSILRRINLAEFTTSTKLEALVEELVRMRNERPGSKALVFSQYVNMLDLIRWRLHSDPCLQDLGIGVRIIHGGMNVQSRDQSLKDFREDNSVRVLLMSLKAGGVALNLTVANEVYVVDPWWNPAAEMQAIDRTHRLGQYRPIRAVRFIAEGTVEERVLQLQEKKRLVFDGTVGRDAASLKMLTVDDMKAMFT